MDECIDSLGSAKYKSTLDLLSSFWQIGMKPEDMDKKAFVCYYGSSRYRKMSFGLMNSPATFQRTIYIILAGFKWLTCLIYLDDIIIFSNDMEQKFKDIEDILDSLNRANVTIKLKNCSFLTGNVKYFGHEMSPIRVHVDLASVAVLSEAIYPMTKAQGRSFWGWGVCATNIGGSSRTILILHVFSTKL